MKKTLFAILVAMAMAFTACSSISIEGIDVIAPQSIEKGSTAETALSFMFNEATPEQSKVDELANSLELSYSISNPEIASVDENGIISAIEKGTADITVKSKDGDISATKTFEVVVLPVNVTIPASIKLDKATNAQASIKAIVSPEDTSYTDVVFNSSDENVATVDNDGMITAVGDGEATITATVNGFDIAATCNVSVAPTITDVILSDNTMSLKVGDSKPLTYDVSPDDVPVENIKYNWETSDDTIATVTDEGVVSANAKGSCSITLVVNGIEKTCDVTVEEKPVAVKNPETNKTNSPNEQAGQEQKTEGTQPAQTAQPTQAPQQASFSYGAVPYSLSANTGTWWNIDSSDSAYWAVAENINAMRAAGGLPALSVDGGMGSIANSRCETFVATGVLSHDGASTSEIIAGGPFGSASSVCESWRNSSGHYAALMSPNYTTMGIGCWFLSYNGSNYSYWCVTFA